MKNKRLSKNKNKLSLAQVSNLDNFFVPQATLDYHNLGVLNAFEVEKMLYEFIEDSEVDGYKNVLVVTGKGKFIRPLVNNLLKKNKKVKFFRSAGYFNGQEGAFEVSLYLDISKQFSAPS